MDYGTPDRAPKLANQGGFESPTIINAYNDSAHENSRNTQTKLPSIVNKARNSNSMMQLVSRRSSKPSFQGNAFTQS